MTRRLTTCLAALWFVCALATTFGCTDRTTEPRQIINPGFGGGETTESDAGGEPVIAPVRELCSPGTGRCVGDNSPFIDRCERDGESLRRERCDVGEVCRNRRCEPFACEPGTQLCLGNVQAVCDPTGRAVEQTVACDEPTVCEGGRCVDLCARASRNSSYIGCEYVALRLDNFYRVESSLDAYPFGVVIANAHPFADATVEVTGPRGESIGLWPPRDIRRFGQGEFFVESRILGADGSRTPIRELPVAVPAGGAAVILFETAVTAARIKSNRPVTAYQFSPYCCNSTFTNDASLLYPVDTWGDRYRLIGYPEFPPIGSPYVGLFSNEPQTIRVSGDTPLRQGFGTGSRAIDGEFTVRANELIYLYPEATHSVGSSVEGGDISGPELRGDAPFATFSGHPCAFVPEDLPACDHLQEQLPPANTLGREYVLTPVLRRSTASDNEGVYWRVTADEDAIITFDPPLDTLELLPPPSAFTPGCEQLVRAGTIQLDEGETCEFGTPNGVVLSSTGDVIVAGVISGQQSTGLSAFGANAGDPSLFVLSPAAQFRESYSFIAPPTYARNFVAVAAPRGEAVVLDGRNVEAEFRSQRQLVELQGRPWEIFVVAIEPGLHDITADEPFGIMVYAMDDYVSYAFVGGLDLLPKGAD